ncbi:MAG TPA: SulP family inorganic anion transporter, partial [Pirellulales bacterium]|nr:SulP family inorganic anion transporter [Pirellulales bacterium]
QLPKLLGIPGGGEDFFERCRRILQELGSTNFASLAIGAAALVLLLLGERLIKGKPVALVVVLLAIGAVWLGKLDQYGISIVGEIPAGLPRLSASAATAASLSLAEGRQIIRLACACFLLSYIESIAAARTFALKHRYDVDPRQELLGLGAGSLAAGLFQGYPVAGGLSQSAVNEGSGARTPLSLVFASATIGCVLLFLTGLFRTLPDAVLAAVVLVAVKGLVDLRELRHLWRASRLDFSAAAVALAGVLLMGVLDGVVVAVLASVLMLLGRTSRPHVAFLGRIPGTDRFTDMARHPDNEPIKGILAFRPQASLLYFNADHVLETVRHRFKAESGVRRVVCDLSNSPYVDVAGARMLRRLDEEVNAAGADFQIVEAHGQVRDILRAEGLEERVGAISRMASLVEVLAESRREASQPH